MSRLTEKLAQAGGVVARATKNIEANADSLIAREAIIADKTKHAFEPHHALLDEAHKGLDALEAQLALLSNDPLPSSGGSQNGSDSGELPAVLSLIPPRQR